MEDSRKNLNEACDISENDVLVVPFDVDSSKTPTRETRITGIIREKKFNKNIDLSEDVINNYISLFPKEFVEKI